MPHPNGGHGNRSALSHTFKQSYDSIGAGGLIFTSSTGEQITATHGLAGDRITPTIVFIGERGRHGNVCRACWGFQKNCSGTRIGHLTVPLVGILPD